MIKKIKEKIIKESSFFKQKEEEWSEYAYKMQSNCLHWQSEYNKCLGKIHDLKKEIEKETNK